MKLAISNIAWTREEDNEILPQLAGWGVQGLEIAPTRIWNQPTAVTPEEASEFLSLCQRHGLVISSMQSLLFGQDHLQLFQDEASRSKLIAYLSKIMELASQLGARNLVFGSPKNRRRGPMPMDACLPIAVDAFRQLGQRAAKLGVTLCIEPNPEVYACDFVTTAEEGRRLVEQVASPGFGLHLDGAGVLLSGGNLTKEIEHSPRLMHFHVSEPQLKSLHLSHQVDYNSALQALLGIGYSAWVAIEMRADPQGGNAAAVRASVGKVRRLLAEKEWA